MLQLISVLALLLITSCSNGTKAKVSPAVVKKPAPVDQPPSATCKDLVLDSALVNYNAKQSNFRLVPMGSTVICGQSILDFSAPGSGHSEVGVLPNLKLDRVDLDPNTHLATVRAELLLPSPDRLRSIAQELGLSVSASKNPVQSADNLLPAHVRLGNGFLFAITKPERLRENEKFILRFQITADAGEEAILAQKISEFLKNQVGLEILWAPLNSISYRQIFGRPEGWSDLDSFELLRAFLRDHSLPDMRAIYLRTLHHALGWGLNLASLSREVPELYLFAENEWRTPTVTDANAQDLLMLLRLLVGNNPQHYRGPVLATFDRVAKLQENPKTALQFAIDFVEGRTWSRQQYDRILEISDGLFGKFQTHSWAVAELLAQRTNFDHDLSAMAVDVGVQMQIRGLIRDPNDPYSIIDSIFGKISAGLNATNRGLYFRAFDSFLRGFSAANADAERASDLFVLTGKVNDNTLPFCFQFLRWLMSQVSLSFTDAIETGAILRNFETVNVVLFEDTYRWIVEEVAIPKVDAIKKVSALMSDPKFNGDFFSAIKEYFSWITKFIVLGKPDAFKKIEAIFVYGVTAQAVRQLEDLAKWYYQTVKLTGSDSLARSEHLILDLKMSLDNQALLKNVFDWLSSAIAMEKNNAAAKAEALLASKRKFNAILFFQFRTQAEWYVSKMNLTGLQALSRAEQVFFSYNLDSEQCVVVRESGEWLVSTVGLTTADALRKSEEYVVKNSLSRETVKVLEREYDAFLNAGKSKSEALLAAEQKVLK